LDYTIDFRELCYELSKMLEHAIVISKKSESEIAKGWINETVLAYEAVSIL